MHHPPGAHHVVRKALSALHAAVAHDDFAAHEPLGHQRQPAVGLRHGIGRGEDHALVVGRLDAHVERHLARNRETGVEVDLGGRDLRKRLFQPHEVLVKIGVVAHVDDHHLEIGVVLGQDQRQTLLDERIVLRKEGYHHRHGRLAVHRLRTAVVLVAGNAAVDENIVVQLHAEHQERRPREGRTLPAIA